MTGWASRKRFWTDAAVAPHDGGWGVALDGRPLRTPARALLTAPTQAAAEACAQEWRAQPETYDPATMPVTRALNSAIDRVAPQFQAVAAEVAAYGETDLLCYRAPAPQQLVDRQAQAWDPWLDWARTRHGAALICVAGVIHAPQPPESIGRLAEAVAALNPWRLTALYELTALSGSLVLGLAVEEGVLEPEKAWPISRIDEHWQIAQWGEDAEAAEVAARKAADFAAAARLAALLR